MKELIPESIAPEHVSAWLMFWEGYTMAMAFTASLDTEEGGSLFEAQGEFESVYPDACDEFFDLLMESEQIELLNDASGFFNEAYELIKSDFDLAGHDFHFSRNGHGTGFWDREWEHGNRLHDMAKVYGSLELFGARNDDDDDELEYVMLMH